MPCYLSTRPYNYDPVCLMATLIPSTLISLTTLVSAALIRSALIALIAVRTLAIFLVPLITLVATLVSSALIAPTLRYSLIRQRVQKSLSIQVKSRIGWILGKKIGAI